MNRFILFAILIVNMLYPSIGHSQEEFCYTNLNQDMNCNTIDVQEEGVVDLLNPECNY